MVENQTIDKSTKDFEIFNEIFGTPQLKSACCHGIEQHYIKTSSLRYWDTQEGFQFQCNLTEKVNKFNQASETYTAIISSYTDWEMEADHDRTWPASYDIRFEKK